MQVAGEKKLDVEAAMSDVGCKENVAQAEMRARQASLPENIDACNERLDQQMSLLRQALFDAERFVR